MEATNVKMDEKVRITVPNPRSGKRFCGAFSSAEAPPKKVLF
jgi:hypothetical protein